MSKHPTQIRIGFFGAAPDTGNMGVSALFSSTVSGLTSKLPKVRFSVFDNGFGKRQLIHQITANESATVDLIGIRAGKRYYLQENFANVSLASRLSFIGPKLNSVLREIDKCDVIFDISGGDSFSDIYGRRRFESTLAPKSIALRRKIPLILLPQTYGPYNNLDLMSSAIKVVKKANMAWARDARSFKNLRQLLGSSFDEDKHKNGVDMAFALNAYAGEHLLDDNLNSIISSRNGQAPVIGLNINGLIYNDPEASVSQYGFKADYNEVIHQFCDWILMSTDAAIVLIPHVMSDINSVESDMKASLNVLDRIPENMRHRVFISPSTLNESQAKWVISKMDWFCGTRMHSTIAGLSSGVATSTIAYSDKAKGVFETCGMGDEVFDPRVSSSEEILEDLKNSYSQRKKTEDLLRENLPDLKIRTNNQFSTIADKVLNFTSFQN